MTAQEAYRQLFARMKEIALLSSTGAVLHWDREAYLPRLADDHRGDQLAQLSRLTHEWFVDPRVGEWLSTIEGSTFVKDPLSREAVNVREWRRLHDRETKLPVSFVEEWVRTGSKSTVVWRDARAASDFSIFQPWLEKVVALCRKKAELIGYKTEIYDALLDEYEPGVTSADVEKAFAGLRTDLVQLISKIKDAPRRPNPGIIKQEFDLERQRLFAESVGAAFGYSFDGGRFDLATHPCCNDLGPRDTRVLTRYYRGDFAEGLTAATHEAGHALYAMSWDAGEQWGTPMGATGSLGIHESQSRMWENIVGRSREFWVHFHPQAQRMFPHQLGKVSVEEMYGAMNWVAPSYIRVESDEATYNLHIMLRFELERAIISGDLRVADIPGEWNSRFKQYLGIEVTDDAKGCLQDVHWSDGGFGYFPTYALGNMLAAQFYRQAERDLPNLREDFTRGSFRRLLDWLSTNIHQQGSRYLAVDLCKKVTGEPLSHQSLLDYLYGKYVDIYGIRR